MNIADAILGLYPNLVPLVDFEVGLDSTGKQVISSWNNSNPQPTQAQLEQGWFQYNRRRKKREFSQGADAEMTAIFPEVSGTSGGWPGEVFFLAANDPKRSQVQGLRAKRIRGYTAIDKKTTVADLLRMVWEDESTW